MNDDEVIENLDLLLNFDLVSEATDMEVVQNLGDLNEADDEGEGQ